MIEEKSGISLKLLISICGVFFIPVLGVIFTVLIFVVKDDDKLNIIQEIQQKQQIQLDTVKDRMERYQYHNNSRFDKLEKKK